MPTMPKGGGFMSIHGTLAIFLVLLTACGTVGLASAWQPPDAPISDQEGPVVPGSPVEGVSGRVTYADGSPAPEITILARSIDTPAQPIPEIGIFTNEDGWYTWPLQPGAYELSPLSDDFVAAPGKVNIRTGDLSRLDFVLVPR